MSDLTSLQPIGDAHLLVEFCVEPINDKPNVTINGAFVAGIDQGGFIEASCFSAAQLSAWEQLIQSEVLWDASRNTLARACGKANSRRFVDDAPVSAFGSFA